MAILLLYIIVWVFLLAAAPGADTCSPKTILNRLSGAFHHRGSIVRCFWGPLNNRFANLETLFRLAEIKYDGRQNFETVEHVYLLADMAFTKSQTKSLTTWQKDFSDAIFGAPGIAVALEKGTKLRSECILYVQKKNLESLLPLLEVEGIISPETLVALKKYLPKVHSFADVRKMVDMACPTENEMANDFSNERILDDLTRAFGFIDHIKACYSKNSEKLGDMGIKSYEQWESEMKSGHSDSYRAKQFYNECTKEFQTFLHQRIRFAHLNLLLKAFELENLIPERFTLYSRPFNTEDDVKKIAEEINNLKGEMTQAEAIGMFREDLLDLSKLPDLHQECYYRVCLNCPEMPTCSDLDEWKVQIKKNDPGFGGPSFTEKSVSVFDECISDIEKRILTTSLQRKFYSYQKNGYILPTVNCNNLAQVARTHVNTCAGIMRVAELLAKHRARATTKVLNTVDTESTPESCYNNRRNELAIAVYSQKHRCFLEPSGERQMNLAGVMKMLFLGIITDWDKFGFNEKSKFEEIGDVYNIARAAYLARQRPKFTDHTHDIFLVRFLNAFFYTKGKPRYYENKQWSNCCVIVQTEGLLLLLLRYEENKIIADRSILTDMRNLVPTASSMPDVRRMAAMACPGYTRTDEFSPKMIESDCAHASGLLHRMTTCFRNFCPNGAIPTSLSTNDWKICREGKPVKDRNIGNDIDKCAKETPFAKSARIVNLYGLLESYEKLGFITRKNTRSLKKSLPSTLEGVTALSSEIHRSSVDFSNQFYHMKERFRKDMKEISSITPLSTLIRYCFKTICEGFVPPESLEKCATLAICNVELNSCAKAQEGGSFGKVRTKIIECIGLNKPKMGQVQALQEKLAEYKKEGLIGNDVIYPENIPKSQKDIDKFVSALYRSYLKVQAPQQV